MFVDSIPCYTNIVPLVIGKGNTNVGLVFVDSIPCDKDIVPLVIGNSHSNQTISKQMRALYLCLRYMTFPL